MLNTITLCDIRTYGMVPVSLIHCSPFFRLDPCGISSPYMIAKSSWPVLGKLSQQKFLKHYWQKRPLLMKGALKPFPEVITPEELAGMCCDDGIESRLIIEKGGKTPWELKRGPFKPSIFKKLPKSHWTVLVNGVDRHIPQVHALLDEFSFIPFWRMDDIMISYAVDQGNVGAHVDNFDVFLVQAAGKREWMIEDRPRLTDDYVPDLPVRLLKDFDPTHSWVLEPGDILYLPPRFPHHGVAQGDRCMTISIGFRAPTVTNLLDSALSRALLDIEETARYSDPDLAPQRPGEISPHAIRKLQNLIRENLTSEEFLTSWFGTFSTEPYDDIQVTKSRRLSSDKIRKALARSRAIVRTEGCRLAYLEQKDGTIRFFANGVESTVAGKAADVARLLADRVVVDANAVAKAIKSEKAAAFLAELLADGVVLLER